MTSLSIAPSSSYEEVTHKAKQQFFASDVGKEGYEYFLLILRVVNCLIPLMEKLGIYLNIFIYMAYILQKLKSIVYRLDIHIAT